MHIKEQDKRRRLMLERQIWEAALGLLSAQPGLWLWPWMEQPQGGGWGCKAEQGWGARRWADFVADTEAGCGGS